MKGEIKGGHRTRRKECGGEDEENRTSYEVLVTKQWQKKPKNNQAKPKTNYTNRCFYFYNIKEEMWTQNSVPQYMELWPG